MARLLPLALGLAMLLGAQAMPDQTAAAPPCPGISASVLAQQAGIHRYIFDQRAVAPFVELWRAAARPALAAPPERVTVYVLPGRPLLIGYQRGDCIIAVLLVERQLLRRWLAPRLGWHI